MPTFNSAITPGALGPTGPEGPSGADSEDLNCLGPWGTWTTFNNTGTQQNVAYPIASGGIRKTAGGDVTITSVEATTPQVTDGQCLFIENLSAAGDITIQDEGATTRAGNRFNLPNNQTCVIGLNEVAHFRWSAASTRWAMVSKTVPCGNDGDQLGDFWRAGGSGYTGFPAGTAADESTTTAVRRAPTGFGWTPGNTAVAKVDINGNNLRTGVANTAVGSSLYATGSLPALSFASGAITTQPPNHVSFQYFNQTQGIGVAYNGLYAAGNNVNQDFVIQNKGAGQMSFNHQAILGSHAYTNHTVGFAPLAGQGWYERWYGQNALHMLELRQRSATGAGLGYETINHTKNSNGGLYAALSLSPTPDSVSDHYLKVGGEGTSEIKLSLYGIPNAAGTSAFGLGIRSSALLVRAAGAANWITMAASSATEIARFRGQGYLQMNPLNAAQTPFGLGMIYWGEAGGNQRPFINGLPGSLHFGYSNAPNSLVVTPNRVRPAMPVYANEAAAAAEVTGVLYRTATGEVRVKL